MYGHIGATACVSSETAGGIGTVYGEGVRTIAVVIAGITRSLLSTYTDLARVAIGRDIRGQQDEIGVPAAA